MAHGPSTPSAEGSVFLAADLGDWYHPVLLGPATVGEMATSPTCLRQAIEIVERLEPDDYVRYLLAYWRAGLERFGSAWRYADILTVLLAAARLLRPQAYLEVGVRRGRSMAMVAATCPDCAIVGFDLWRATYAGIPSGGPELVRTELSRLGHKGRLELLAGDSHRLLPAYLSDHPDAFFDLITVDGDHSRRGAEQDLRDLLPRLKVGGVMVFDDICHPKHPYLTQVWQRVIVGDPRLVTWQYTDLGYGVALAMRREP